MDETSAQCSFRTLRRVEVALVHWPFEAERRARLEEERQPRLLLIEDGAEPPAPADCLEDWIRMPAPEMDVRRRMVALTDRARDHRAEVPTLDTDGVLRFGDRWVALPPIELVLMRVLLDRFGAVTRRELLSDAAWPRGMPTRNVLDVHVLRLRRRVLDLGLTIKTVRSRGYLLEAGPSDAARRRLEANPMRPVSLG